MTVLICVFSFALVFPVFLILFFARAPFWLAYFLTGNFARAIALEIFLTIALYVAFFFAWYAVAKALRKLMKKQGEKSFGKRVKKSGVDPFEYTKASVPPHVVERCEEMIKQSETAVVGYLRGISDMGIIKKKQAEILIDGYSKLARQVPRK